MKRPFVIVPVSRYTMAENVAENLRRQSSDFHPIIVEVGHARGQVQQAYGPGADYVTCWSATPGQARNLGVARAMRLDPSAPVVFMDDDDWYAAAFVLGQLQALRFHPESAWVAKPQMFIESGGMMYCLDRDAQQHRNGPSPGATIAVRRARDCLPFSDMMRGEDHAWKTDMVAAGRDGWTGDGYHYLYRLHRDNVSRATVELCVDIARTEAIEVGPVDYDVVQGRKEVTGTRVGPNPDRVLAALEHWSAEEAAAGTGPLGARTAEC